MATRADRLRGFSRARPRMRQSRRWWKMAPIRPSRRSLSRAVAYEMMFVRVETPTMRLCAFAPRPITATGGLNRI